MSYVDIAARLLIGVVFVVALAGKVSSAKAYRAFEASVAQMGAVPVRSAPIAARATIVAEALVIVLLAIPARQVAAAGFLIAAGLLLAFAAAIARSLRGGNRAPCRCFGASSTPLGRGHIIRNTLLTAVALAGLLATLLPGALLPGAPTLPGALLAALVGGVAGGLTTAADDITALIKG